MKFEFKDLNEHTRQGMLDEIMEDVSRNQLYSSKRFNENGLELYRDLLRAAALMGDEESLASELNACGCFRHYVERKSGNGVSLLKVPEAANKILAQGEFNRYYIRSVCREAIAKGRQVVIYRARFSLNTRIESEMIIGKTVDPEKLLNDLRNKIGVETSLGIPGVNSGLSVRLI